MKHGNAAVFVPHEGCPHKCVFCNQHSISGATAYEEQAAKAVFETALNRPNHDPAHTEIAFFGGSFTLVPRFRMLSLLGTAFPYVRDGFFRGIRISTRPDAVNQEILTLLKSYGVTAVELGAQSMSNQVLSLNGRGHTAEDTENAAVLIKSAGLELGLQMMTGLHGETPGGEMETARCLIALSPDTVRIYPCLVMKNTLLEQLYNKGEYSPRPLDEEVSLCAKLLYLFHKKNIPVIRLGLHAGTEMQTDFVAGPWHPAFRELCESEIYRGAALAALRGAGIDKGGATLYVAPASLSKMIGQRRNNLKLLREQGFECSVKERGGLGLFEVLATGGS